MFVSIAHAMAPSGGAGGEPNALLQFAPLLLMLVIFYFLLIRPQQKRAKQHREMLGALKKGDTVMTSGGLVGRIVDMDGDILSIDLGETKVNVGRGYVVNLANSPAKAAKETPKQAPKEASKEAPKEDSKEESKDSE